MKLRTVVKAFSGITTVYASIEDFNRKWDLRLAYKELKELIELFNKEREDKLKDLAIDGIVPQSNLTEANRRIDELADREIELQHSLMFTIDEIKESKIPGPQILEIEDFIQFKQE